MIIKLAKFFISSLILLPSLLFSSDEISIDSLFDMQTGTRSITNFTYISSSSSRSYNIYPVLSSYDDGTRVIETKKSLLNQTFVYSYNKNIDILTSFSGEKSKIDYVTDVLKSKESYTFSNYWLGLKYNFDYKVAELKQSITAQVSLYEKNSYREIDETTNLKSFYLKYNLLAYIDPVAVNLFVTTIQNSTKTIGALKIDYPDLYTIGLDTNIVLNPSISLSLNFEQTFQQSMKENDRKVNPSTTISLLGFGMNYNINPNNALIVTTSVGTSSDSPNSRLSLALWHKF